MKLEPPTIDPSPIFEIFRGNYAMELLTAAVAHFGVFEELAPNPLSRAALQSTVGLGDRQFIVLLTGLKALALVDERIGLLVLPVVVSLKDAVHDADEKRGRAILFLADVDERAEVERE